MCGAGQRSTSKGGGPLWEGWMQAKATPSFFHSGLLIISPSFLPPPSHLSISQTVVHLPPCAAVSICSLLTWPFTSDPIPTILIKTESHYGGFLWLLYLSCTCASLPSFRNGDVVCLHWNDLSSINGKRWERLRPGDALRCWRFSKWPRKLSGHVWLCGAFISSGPAFLTILWWSLAEKDGKKQAEKERGF